MSLTNNTFLICYNAKRFVLLTLPLTLLLTLVCVVARGTSAYARFSGHNAVVGARSLASVGSLCRRACQWVSEGGVVLPVLNCCGDS